MNGVERAANQLIDEILASEYYKAYETQKERMKGKPELRDKINEFRERNFQLQNLEDSDELFDEVDKLEREYELFSSDPIVGLFLEAELNFCRMIQDINYKIVEAIEFE